MDNKKRLALIDKIIFIAQCGDIDERQLKTLNEDISFFWKKDVKEQMEDMKDDELIEMYDKATMLLNRELRMQMREYDKENF